MDLAQFDTRKRAEKGVEVTLTVAGMLLRGGDEEPIKFKIKGIDSSEIRAHLADLRKAGDGASATESMARDREFAALLCVGWSDNAVMGGEPFPYSEENAKIFFAFPPVCEALIEAASERRNFI